MNSLSKNKLVQFLIYLIVVIFVLNFIGMYVTNYYFNDGDWVESLSAIVEDYEGNMKIVSFESQLNTKQELVKEF